jgi:hypothetical protein
MKTLGQGRGKSGILADEPDMSLGGLPGSSFSDRLSPGR